MHVVALPPIGTALAWRNAARGLLAAGIPPAHVTWESAGSHPTLFSETAPAPVSHPAITVPSSYVALANTVVWHSDPSRFARLYDLLWRLRKAPHLMQDRGDPDIAILRRMEKNVRRCQHKMKAFVRFRDVGDAGSPRRQFAAWFEPTHHTVEPTAAFFADRFGDMDWRILTPDVSAICESGKVRIVPGETSRPPLPEDASEDLWKTYFRNIFNPARLKVKAMTSEMPRKYWKNLPEAEAIPDLVSHANSRAAAMAAAAPLLPPVRSERIKARLPAPSAAWSGPAEGLAGALTACTRCPLHKDATQTVCGEGPTDARLMIVGEQPGDHEDLTGRPLVGPAGQLFDQIAAEAGIDRRTAYITNAVKHFKFIAKGKRRIHQRPNRSEIETCQWWLDAERQQIKPQVILGMGATAAFALTGDGAQISQRRGQPIPCADGSVILLTYHPADLLRCPQGSVRDAAVAAFAADLRLTVSLLEIGSDQMPPNI